MTPRNRMVQHKAAVTWFHRTGNLATLLLSTGRCGLPCRVLVSTRVCYASTSRLLNQFPSWVASVILWLLWLHSMELVVLVVVRIRALLEICRSRNCCTFFARVTVATDNSAWLTNTTAGCSVLLWNGGFATYGRHCRRLVRLYIEVLWEVTRMLLNIHLLLLVVIVLGLNRSGTICF